MGLVPAGSVVLLVIKAMAAPVGIRPTSGPALSTSSSGLGAKRGQWFHGRFGLYRLRGLDLLPIFDRAWLHEVLTLSPWSQVLDLDWDYQICFDPASHRL